MTQSLRLRLLVGAVLAIAFILLLVASGLSRIFSNYVADRYRADMSAIIDQLAAGVEFSGGRARMTDEPGDPRFELPGSGLYWQVVGENDLRFRSRSLWDVELAADALQAGPYGFREGQGPDGALILVQLRDLVLETPEGNRPLTLLAGFDRKVMDDAISEYHGAMTIMLVLTAAVLLAAAFLQVGIGLAPLSRLQDGLALVRSGRTDQLPDAGPTELRPLVGELNGLLRERETAIERARARASDLAHGLKTPLTVLLQLADNLPDRERSMIRQQVDLIRQRADRQLQSARLGVEQMAQTGLASLTGKLVSVLAPVTAARGVTWQIGIDEGLTADMDPADLAEALGNVLDNATRYARTAISVSAAHDGEFIRLDVEDDGPGVDDEDLAAIARRGVHLAEDEGTGLGLAISTDVLAAYGGRIMFGRSERGGLKVGLFLPARP
ncbi:HAMP domain-containing histidine kinase [Rhizobium sp. WL3]|jgi:signal transduction histidine kinase|uniref:sensor histidine kinase n=1 Tax=Rhizobium sp. WL3 TaxID=2603277 RepID=UPI0011C1EF4E|nr:HAMP domain-containing sensor histidine kinase [Rhizobium sp. WL3]MBX9469629.1 HAMP domain-containing histidine kinase [Rhizobium sp.]QEE46107.1 HAMP domain-containing histidine kinase [Rhizobium sp. WL3]